MNAATLERVHVRERALALPARWILALMSGASALLLVILGTRLTFFNDDWYFLLQRPGIESHGGIDTLLAPHNGNLEVLLATLYKTLVAVFGLGTQVPYRLVIAVTVVCLGTLVYTMVSERLGPVVGLCAAAVILFLGPAWEAVLFFGGSNHLMAVTFGLGALFALEVDTRARSALACLLLVLAVSVSNTGVPFVAGAVIAVLVRRRPTQLWVPAVPAALFALWWALYGHKQPTGVSIGHVEHLPRYVFDALSIGLASVTGLVHGSLPGVISTGHVLTVMAALLVLAWLVRGGRPTACSLVFAGTLVVFWLLAGASATMGRGPTSSRYQMVDATLLIVLGAELLRGRVLDRRGLSALGAITAVIVASNLLAMGGGYDFLRVRSGYAQADLGALQIARPLAPPGLWLVQSVAQDPYLSGVTAGRYFAVTHAHGTPPFYTPAQILGALPGQRRAADSVLAAAYGMATRPAGTTGVFHRCSVLPATGAEGVVAAPGVVIRNLSDVPLVIGVARFAPPGLPVYLGFLTGRGTARIDIPSDSVSIPWRVTVLNPARTAGAAVDVCRSVT